MKSCDEMVNSLLERKADYEAEQKRKKRTAVRISGSLCCVCIIAVLGIGVNKSGLLDSKPPVEESDKSIIVSKSQIFNQSSCESTDQTGNNTEIIPIPTYPTTDIITETKTKTKTESTYPSTNTAEEVTKPYDTKGNIINVEPITGGLSAAKMNICLHKEDFISMSQQEMIEYYGVNYIPDVPEDMKPWENETSGIYRRNGGTGEVYWDKDILNFSNDDFTREVSLEITKGHIPFCDYIHFRGTEEMSVINGEEVFVGLTSSGYYYTEFMYKGAGFIIIANGVTEEEFVAIIASIIE